MLENKLQILTRLMKEDGAEELTLVETTMHNEQNLYLPWNIRDIYVPTGRYYDVWNEVGSRIAVLQGLKPVKGGNVMYREV